MKNLIILTFLVLSFASCKDESNLSEDILGTWTISEADYNEDFIGGTFVFNENTYTNNVGGTYDYYLSKDTMFIRTTPTSPYFAHSTISIDGNRMEQNGLTGDMYFTVYSR